MGAAAYLDDILEIGNSEEELHGLVEKVPEGIEKYGFHLWADKCHFSLIIVKFLIPMELASFPRCLLQHT
ncbi:unnamed protein product [Hymenolepis diminuta]|uniref:Reverse transcriptase domain-containing protein n=1 Tax=Hymenolepis diminuta TaxID=6216 RepID=A0A564XZL9_HYMDI|nr:unnamed protein product [Hymenolepis diminuta]